jgi:hypothetical protein
MEMGRLLIAAHHAWLQITIKFSQEIAMLAVCTGHVLQLPIDA